LSIEVTAPARDLLAGKGFDPAFGARPLKRTLQQEIENPLALRILEGEFPEGSTIRVDARGGKFAFSSLPAVAAAEAEKTP
jgi:ATP-dependent Clp protease ATP-binding subunit ClpB